MASDVPQPRLVRRPRTAAHPRHLPRWQAPIGRRGSTRIDPQPGPACSPWQARSPDDPKPSSSDHAELVQQRDRRAALPPAPLTRQPTCTTSGDQASATTCPRGPWPTSNQPATLRYRRDRQRRVDTDDQPQSPPLREAPPPQPCLLRMSGRSKSKILNGQPGLGPGSPAGSRRSYRVGGCHVAVRGGSADLGRRLGTGAQLGPVDRSSGGDCRPPAGPALSS
jgi:hypothetical protein